MRQAALKQKPEMFVRALGIRANKVEITQDNGSVKIEPKNGSIRKTGVKLMIFLEFMISNGLGMGRKVVGLRHSPKQLYSRVPEFSVSTKEETEYKYGEPLTMPDSVGVSRNTDKQASGDSGGFFRAPHLHVESISDICAKVQIGTTYNSDYSLKNAESFECISWVVKIHSDGPAFSILKGAYAEAYVTTDTEESTLNAARLPWKNMKEPPTRFMSEGIPEGDTREYYKKIFGYYYGEELERVHVSPRIDIRKGGIPASLYFLLTFRDSPYAYVLTTSGYPGWSDNKVEEITYANHIQKQLARARGTNAPSVGYGELNPQQSQMMDESFKRHNILLNSQSL